MLGFHNITEGLRNSGAGYDVRGDIAYLLVLSGALFAAQSRPRSEDRSRGE